MLKKTQENPLTGLYNSSDEIRRDREVAMFGNKSCVDSVGKIKEEFNESNQKNQASRIQARLAARARWSIS